MLETVRESPPDASALLAWGLRAHKILEGRGYPVTPVLQTIVEIAG